MWNILAEQPMMVSIMIGVIVVGLLYAWMQTGDKRIALSALGIALLIPGSYLLAGAVVTDREMILETIHRTATAVEKNDHETAVAVIADDAVRQRALAELPRFEFHKITVRNIKVDFVQGSYPPEASVDIDASVRASLTKGPIRYARVVRRVILTFQQQPDGNWQVTDYTHLTLTGDADNFTPNRI